MKGEFNSLYDLFAAHAAERGDAAAFISTERTVSYAEFLNQVDALAAGFNRQGLGNGDRVATLAKNSILHFAALVACTRLGAVVYPANWRLASSELKQVVDLIDPAALLIEADFHGSLSEIDLSRFRIKGLLGKGSVSAFVSVEEMQPDMELPQVSIKRDDPAVIIATAAVAGVPRGAVLTHGNLISVGRMFTSTYNLSETDRYLGVLPLFHIAGLEYLVVMAMAGGASVILPGFDAVLSDQMMEEHQVSLITTFPPMLEKLIAARQQSGSEWNNLRVCFGILNPPEVIQQYLDLDRGDYWTGYGQTETTGIATLVNFSEKPGSAGRVVDGLEMRIVDEQERDVPKTQPGEIIVRGNLVFAGYWRDDAASAYAARGGWHHTGDLGKVDDAGYLFYVGRKPEKELIKSGGENIYPAEVESAIRMLPEVEEVCVIGLPDDKWGETVKAVIELTEGKQLNEDQLLEGIKDNLANYKKPRVVEFVAHLPRDESGEVDRNQVKAKYG